MLLKNRDPQYITFCIANLCKDDRNQVWSAQRKELAKSFLQKATIKLDKIVTTISRLWKSTKVLEKKKRKKSLFKGKLLNLWQKQQQSIDSLLEQNFANNPAPASSVQEFCNMTGQAMRTSCLNARRGSLGLKQKLEKLHIQAHDKAVGILVTDRERGCSTSWGKQWNNRLARCSAGRSKGWVRCREPW